MGIFQRALSGSEKRSLSVGWVGGRLKKKKKSIFHPFFSQEIISVTHNARFLKAGLKVNLFQHVLELPKSNKQEYFRTIKLESLQKLRENKELAVGSNNKEPI